MNQFTIDLFLFFSNIKATPKITRSRLRTIRPHSPIVGTDGQSKHESVVKLEVNIPSVTEIIDGFPGAV